MKIRVYLVLALALLVIATGCKNKGKKNKGNKTSLITKQFMENQIDFEWFYSKANIRFKSPQLNQSFTSTIKIRKDSLIWLNIKKFGIEAGRALITPDSVFVLNRLEKSVYKRDFSYLEQFNLEADFQSLQHLLIGNAIYVNEEAITTEKNDEGVILSSKNEATESQYFLSPETYLLQKMLIKDLANDLDMTFTYDKYEPLGASAPFARERQINTNSEQTGEIAVNILFNKIVFNKPQTFPFQISSRYTVL